MGRGREEEEEEKDSREGDKVRYEIVQTVVAGHEKKAKARAQVDVNQSVQQSWDCLQIEDEEEDEGEKLEEILERRRMEGSCLQADIMQKVRELVVHERTSQGEKVK